MDAASSRETGRKLHGNRPNSGEGDARPAAAGPLLAVLDLGTNNCRLLIASPGKGGFRVTDSFSRIVRLGEGVGQTGLLSDAALDRTIAALRSTAPDLIVPCHCTGDQAASALKDALGERVTPGAAGMVLRF